MNSSIRSFIISQQVGHAPLTARWQLAEYPADLLPRQLRHLFFPTPAAVSARTPRPTSSAPCGDATPANCAPHTRPAPPRPSRSETRSRLASVANRPVLTSRARSPQAHSTDNSAPHCRPDSGAAPASRRARAAHRGSPTPVAPQTDRSGDLAPRYRRSASSRPRPLNAPGRCPPGGDADCPRPAVDAAACARGLRAAPA